MPINSTYMRMAGDGALDRDDEERRTRGRMPMEGLRCDHGLVVDLSPGGALIRRSGLFKWSIGDERILIFRFCDEQLAVKAKVVREIKEGLLKKSYGMKFINLTPTQSAKIMELAQACRPQTSVAQESMFG